MGGGAGGTPWTFLPPAAAAAPTTFFDLTSFFWAATFGAGFGFEAVPATCSDSLTAFGWRRLSGFLTAIWGDLVPPDVGGVDVEGGVVELVLVVVMDVGLLAADFLSDDDVWVGVVGATAAAAAASCFFGLHKHTCGGVVYCNLINNSLL